MYLKTTLILKLFNSVVVCENYFLSPGPFRSPLVILLSLIVLSGLVLLIISLIIFSSVPLSFCLCP